MAIYTASATTTAGSATLPAAGIYQPASPTGIIRVRAIEVFAEVATAVTEYAIRRITAIGTPGAAQTLFPHDTSEQAAAAIVATTWTVAPTLSTGSMRKFPTAAAVGAGVMYRFPPAGELLIPKTANNGIVVVLSSGTGQALAVNFEWEEVL
jgi:hypothetical protein